MATDILNSKKVLISGGTGFVGSATVRALADKHPGSAITVIDRSPPQTQHPLPKGIRCIQVDITSANEVARVLQTLKPNIVVHTAGIVPSLADRFGRELEREVWRTNVEGTRNMLNASLENDVEAFIYTSSCCVVTDNTSTPYRNIDEEWPTSNTSLIYGESKVVEPPKKSQEMGLALTKNSHIGRSRAFGPRGRRQQDGDLRPSSLCPMRGRRLSISPVHPRLHCQV